MAEMSHPPADISFPPCEFQLCRRFRKGKLKDLWIRPSRRWRTGTENKEVRYEVSKIFGAAWIAGLAAGVLASRSQIWRRHRIRARLRGRTSSVRLRLLLVLSVCVCALRILWAELFRERSLYRRRPLVSRIRSPVLRTPLLCRLI